jgi:hypothetical protein
MGQSHLRRRARQQRHPSADTVSDQRGADLRTRARRLPAFLNPPERLEDRTLLAGNPFTSIANSLNSDLQLIQGQLDQALNAASVIPIVNHAVGNLTPVKTFIDNARGNILARLQTLGMQNSAPTDVQIEQAFLDALGPQSGLNRLGDLNGNGVGLDDVRVLHTPDGFTVEMRIHEGEEPTTTSGFSIGLPSLPIKLDAAASFSVMVGVDYELAFHYNASLNTTTLDPSAKLTDFGGTGSPHEFSVSLDTIVLPGQFQATATVGFLQGMLAPTTGKDTSFHGHLNWDGLDRSTPAGVDGTANINLTLSGGFGGGVDFPMIGAEFHLAWAFDSHNPQGNAPQVGVDNVTLDLGGFLSGLLGPIFAGINRYVGPLKGPLDVITRSLPGISDLSELLGEGPVSLLTLASIAGNQTGYGPLVTLVNTLVPLIQEANKLTDTVNANGHVAIKLGGFNLSGDNGDLRNAPEARDVNDLGQVSLTQLAAHPTIGIDNSAVPAEVGGFLDNLVNPAGKLRFDFPILDNPEAAVFGLILGKDSPLASFTATFHLEADPSNAPGLSFAGFGVSVTASAVVDAYFRFAYDTRGLREVIHDIGDGVSDAGRLAGDVADGFYIDASSHLSVSGSVGLRAGFQYGPLGFHLDGNIGTGANGRGDDPAQAIRIGIQGGSDGKVRFRDFNSHTITAHGELAAGLSATLQFGVEFLGTFIGFTHTFDIANQVLLILNSDNPPPTPPKNQLASAPDANGRIILYVGDEHDGSPGADSRQIFDAAGKPITDANVYSTSSDDYTIAHVSQEGDTETVDVTANKLGATETIHGVRSIYASPYGGLASDTRTINVEDGVTSRVELHGGEGHADLTYSGTGLALLYAGILSSTLVGGKGANFLTGGDGDDTLVATPHDFINGGRGNNTIIIKDADGGLGDGTIVSGGSTQNANNTLVVIEPLGSAATTITDFGANQLKVTSQHSNTAPAGKKSNASSLSLIAANFRNIAIGGNYGYSDITIGDLSETSVTDIKFDVTTHDEFLRFDGHNTVRVIGSPSDARDDFSTIRVTNGSAAAADVVALNQLFTERGKTPRTKYSSFEINGLFEGTRQGRPDDAIILDGNGGTNVYNLTPDPREIYGTIIQDTGPAPIDDVNLFGSSLPEGAVDVSDSGVTFTYKRTLFGFVVTAFRSVDLDSHVNSLFVGLPDGADVVTASRNIGTTTIQGGKVGGSSFHVSGASTYAITATGDNAFVVDLPSVAGTPNSTQTLTTIREIGAIGTGTLVVNDLNNVANLYTTYLATRSGLTRTADDVALGKRVQHVSTVDFGFEFTTTFNVGGGVNVIDVEQTGLATTINGGPGVNLFQVSPTAMNLDVIGTPRGSNGAGLYGGALTINGAGGYSSLAVFDKHQSGRDDEIHVDGSSVLRDSFGNNGTGVYGFTFYLSTINYTNLAAISITAPTADLTVQTSPSNVYYVAASLSAVPKDNTRHRILTAGGFPALDFNDSLTSVHIIESSPGTAIDVDSTPVGCATAISLNYLGRANVHATEGPLTIDDGSFGQGFVDIGMDGSVQAIQGPVVVQSGHSSGLVQLVVHDAADYRSRSVTITSSSINGLYPAVISYDQNALSSLTIEGSSGLTQATRRGKGIGPFKGSNYGVLSTPYNAAIPGQLVTTLVCNSVDTVNVGNQGSALGIAGNLAIISPKQSTTLNIDASGDGAPLSRRATATGNIKAKRAGVAKRFVMTSAGRIAAVVAPRITTKAIKTAASRTGQGVAPIGQNLPQLQPIIIDSDRVSGLSFGDITFASDGLTGLTVYTPRGGRTIQVQGTPNQGVVGSVVTSLIGHGLDTVYVGDDSGRLSRVHGALDVANPTSYSSLFVDGSTEPAAHSVTITPGAIRGLAPAGITYAANDVNSIDLKGGTGGNTFHVAGTIKRAPVTVDGGSGANVLIGPDIVQTWNISANDAGKVGDVKFARVGSLTGGQLADTFLPSDGANLSGRIDGGAGVNTLDLSAQSRNVAVDLRSAVATGIKGGVTNIVNLTGGRGTNVLVGDANANRLKGGSVRNILIGGGGIDQVLGGTGDNILIGGGVASELTLSALDAVMREFTRTDEDFLTRLTHILSGNGTNDPAYLNPDTVVNDGAANVLTGGSGSNWFFAPDALTPKARKPSDVVTIIK